MKTLFIVIALSSLFAGLASAATNIGWDGGSSSIDTRPSLGGHADIQMPIDTQPSYGGRVEIGQPSFPPPIYDRPHFPRYERRYEVSGEQIEIRRYRRHRHYRHRHWADEPVRYEIYDDEPVVRIEVPRYEHREEVEIDSPIIREMVGNILGVNFSARWN